VNLVDELHAIAAALTRAGIPYAVCGGVAVTIYGATRSTKDIDMLVGPEDLPRALDAVRPLGYACAVLPVVFDEGTERERHVQRVLDLLLARSSLAGLLDDRIEVMLPEGSLSVVSRGTLLRMKRMAARSQDLADLERLEHPDEP
jgi:hypothetical protein